MLLVQGMEASELETARQWATAVNELGDHIPVAILIAPTVACLQKLAAFAEDTRLMIICIEVLAAEDSDTPMATITRLHGLYPAALRKKMQTVITGAPVESECFGGYGSRDAVIILEQALRSRDRSAQRVTLLRSAMDLVATRIYIEASNGAIEQATAIVDKYQTGCGEVAN